MLEARRFVVRGHVQGVGFRYFAREYTLIEGLHGWVTNRADGAVEVSAEGERESLRRFENRMRKGPPGARVEDVLVEDDLPTGRTGGFEDRDVTGSRIEPEGMDKVVMEALKQRIRHVPDFPKPGILFYDVTTLLQDREGFRLAVDAMTEPYRNSRIDTVVGIESRGFIFGAAVADRLNVGFAPVRKPGKLPSTTRRASYALEYGTDTLEIHDDAVKQGQRVLIVDDLLATGGTAAATVGLIRELGADVVGVQFLIELVGLNGRDRLPGENVGVVLRLSPLSSTRP